MGANSASYAHARYKQTLLLHLEDERPTPPVKCLAKGAGQGAEKHLAASVGTAVLQQAGESQGCGQYCEQEQEKLRAERHGSRT